MKSPTYPDHITESNLGEVNTLTNTTEPHEYASLRTSGNELSLVKSVRTNSVHFVHRMPLYTDPGSDFDVVKMKLSGICGADIRFAHGTKKVSDQPDYIVLGHSCVGQVGDHWVAAMVHLIPSELKKTQAYESGAVFQLEKTYHAGMDVNGTFATQLMWPKAHLTVIPQNKIKKAQENSMRPLPEAAVFCELEHVACVETAIEHMLEQEKKWGGNTAEKMIAGGAVIAVLGIGPMGMLMLTQLQRKYPQNQYCMVDPNTGRKAKIASIFQRNDMQVPADISDQLNDYSNACDLVILATAAMSAISTAFKLVKPKGHIMLFSGFNEPEAYDPTGVVNLERVHRLGTGLSVEVMDQKPYILSGSSGYSVTCFHEAIDVIVEIAGVLSLSITGVIERDSNVLRSLEPEEHPDYISNTGPVLERVFDRDGDWPKYVANHMKILWLAEPWEGKKC